MPIQVFIGHRDMIGHTVKRVRGEEDEFTDEIKEWCVEHLSGPAELVYQRFDKPNEQGEMTTYARYEVIFENEEDAALFALFHVRRRA
jgi:hypothetical protein